jgi:ATP-dependent Clp protease ATP-binding subunit ClpC
MLPGVATGRARPPACLVAASEAALPFWSKKPPEPTGNEEDARWYAGGWLDQLYRLQQLIASRPPPSTPEDLLKVRPFMALVEELSAADVGVETLERYATGEDAVLAWGALAALATRPHDAAVEQRLLHIINGFHPWTRHFILRLAEVWHPEDPALAGRVLLGLDGSWDNAGCGMVLASFLRRRAGVAPPSLDDAEPRPYPELEALRNLLRRWVDPGLAEAWLEALETLAPSADLRPPPGFPGAPPVQELTGSFGSLSDLGRVTAPPGVDAEGLLGCPSADAQLERVLSALAGQPRRSVLVVGDPGVGKSTLVRRAAARLSRQDWTIFEAGAGQINAGMSFVGSLEGRIHRLVQTLGARPRMLWIVPDFHQLLWSGRSHQSPTGALELLLPALESSSVVVLGETRTAALDRLLTERPEIARLFEIVRLEPPSESETASMVGRWAEAAAERERIAIPPAVRDEAAALARQYLLTEPPPGGVLRLLGEALAHAQRRLPAPGAVDRALSIDDLLAALGHLTGLPLDILDERTPLDLDAVRRRFGSRVIGQPEAVDCLVDRLALLKAGITDPHRPTGVFLFVGGSGTGKTELARTLADYLFGSPERIIRIDMSELQDAHALERLLGDAGTLVGRGNSLAERVRRQPFSLVLLDEFDRAHPSVWDLFLQVFDAGRLTDHRGETADFRHSIIILTSNLGTAAGGPRLGLVEDPTGSGAGMIQRAVERAFRPELLNRLDRVVVFRPLTRDVMRRILGKELADAFARRGLRRRDWAVELEESAIELLVDRGFSATLGARPLRRALERLLLTPLAAAIVDRRAPEGDQFLFVRADGDGLAVEFVDPDAPATTAPIAGARAAPGAPARPPRDLASITFEAHGSAHELESLEAALAELQGRVSASAWSTTKESLLLEIADAGFWTREDRFERLGRAEYMDRIESGVRSASSLFERLRGSPGAPRESYPREMVRRLAQQLYLVDAACAEALDQGPRDAFVAVEPSPEDLAPAGVAAEFAGRLARMYEAWARARGMRFAALGPLDGAAGSQLMAIAGFAAYRLLAPEAGLHVLEWDEPGGRAPRRASVRVRVEPQPATPAREGAAGLRRQAEEALGAHAGGSGVVVRRYREQPSPLVKDLVRGWRTGRLERVLGGEFDVIPAHE